MIQPKDITEGATLIDEQGVTHQVGAKDDYGFYYTTPNGYTYRCEWEELNQRFKILRKPQ